MGVCELGEGCIVPHSFPHGTVPLRAGHTEEMLFLSEFPPKCSPSLPTPKYHRQKIPEHLIDVLGPGNKARLEKVAGVKVVSIVMKLVAYSLRMHPATSLGSITLDYIVGPN